MKKLLQYSFIFSFLIFTVSYSYSIPLNGTYTIGSGGDYPSTASAFGDAQNLGISGPVTFSIFTGVYNDGVYIPVISGSSTINTITLKSQSGNSSDVILKSLSIAGSNVTVQNLSFDSGYVQIGPYQTRNINIISNDFRNNGINIHAFPSVKIRKINILGNINVENMYFFGEYWFGQGEVDTVQIKNNFVNGTLSFSGSCANFSIEGNTIYGGMLSYGGPFKIIKNRIFGRVITAGNYINNFINGTILSGGNFINNTIIGGSLDTPTVKGGHYFNNIIINPNGGTVLSSVNGGLESDYNVYYNGGNSNLISYDGISYNNIQDFYNATGFDQHTTSEPVSFVSPTDFHLAFSSLGDPQLLGIPDTSVADDIDGELRNPLYPYKGADETFVNKVNLALLFEGIFYPSFNLLKRKDSLSVYIRNSISPFNLVDSAKTIIDSISFTTGSLNLNNTMNGTYYIIVKHFNSVETWSKYGGEQLTRDSSTYFYDFTASTAQAYGNNLKLKGSKYCIYSGDVNQDGFINLSDVIPINNDASNFVSGNYLVADLTGDNIVDLTDVSLCYNNASNFIAVIRP